MDFEKNAHGFRSWMRYVVLVPMLSLLSVSCKDSTENLTPSPTHDLVDETAAWGMLSPTVKLEIDALANNLSAYAKLQAENKEMPKMELDELFRKQRGAQPNVSIAQVEAAIELADVLSARENNAQTEIAKGHNAARARIGATTYIYPTQWADASYDMLPGGAKSVLEGLKTQIGALESSWDNAHPDNIQTMVQIQSLFDQAGQAAAYAGDIPSQDDRISLMESIYSIRQMIPAIHMFVINNYTGFMNDDPSLDWPGARSGWCWRCVWRAVARVAVVAAVTVAVITIPAALAVAAKGWSAMWSAGVAVAKNGITIAAKNVLNLKVQASLKTGLSSGVKRAAKKWNTGWEGASEFRPGIKVYLGLIQVPLP